MQDAEYKLAEQTVFVSAKSRGDEKMKKKVLAAVLMASMVMGTLPIAAAADESKDRSGCMTAA